MSKKNLISFLRFASSHDKLAAHLNRSLSYEDFTAIAAERGYDIGELNAHQIKRTVEIVTGQLTEKLSIDELELVATAGDLGNPAEAFAKGAQWSFCNDWKC